jgi:hypothetical protein
MNRTPTPEEAQAKVDSIRADSLFLIIKKGFVLIGISFKQLTLRMLLSDFFAVLRSIGFVSIPAFLVGFLFLILPQGRDTLLIVVEQMMEGNWWSLFGLLTGITFWSIFSELAVRYSISVSDNSGMNLSDERVLWRKTVQKLLAGSFLLWPGILVLIALGITMFTAEYIPFGQRIIFIGIAILMVLIIIWIISFLYFHKFAPRKKERAKRTLLGHRSLPPEEQRWLDKLYGIYNDYIFTMPKPTNFKGSYKDNLQDFTDLYIGNTPTGPDDFPKDTSALAENRVIPAEFELKNSGKVKSSVGLFKWVYCLPPLKFYKIYHKKVASMSIVSAALLVLISLIPASWPIYDHIGAPGLVCIAFACYTGVYTGLLFLDKAIIPKFPISIRLFLIIWGIGVSACNQDHPVRLYGERAKRPDLTENFRRWFGSYKQKMDQRIGHPLEKYPVIFVCAEGGAFRTGAYTALFLTQMESDLTRRADPVDFRNSIFAMSGVSGGSVGLGFYNAVAFRSFIPVKDTTTVAKTRKFFLHDSLSPLIGKMFFGEFLNLFYWHQADNFDRAAALEISWESAYEQYIGKGNHNTYTDEFIQPDTGRARPALIINTTEIETGRQCWISTVQTSAPLFSAERDLLNGKISQTRYSTAINFSSRFPLFSPGAEINIGRGHRRHYLDGGYVENTGSATMLEILQELKKTPEWQQIKPVLISLRFSESKTDIPDIKTFNELTEIFNGLYNTRSGRNEIAITQLRSEVIADSGIFIPAPLSPLEKDIPMNWVLSEQSMNRIQADIKKKLDPKNDVIKRFFSKAFSYLPYKN